MERREPTLVPEWLKATAGSSTSNISTSNSSLHSSSSLRSGQRNKLAVSSSDLDFRRSASLIERSSSSLSRRSLSSNGSGTPGKALLSSSRPYSSSRRNRDKCLERELDHNEKEKLSDNGCLDSPIVSIAERAVLQRSKSLVARRLTDSWPKKGNNGTINSSISVRNPISSVGRSLFEREFPSLGSEEKPSSPEITRVSSPARITVPQVPLLSSSTVIGGEGWTSCLADVPSRIASNGAVHASVNHSAPVSSVVVTATASISLNMAETVAQAPLRARTTPQLSVETQRLEELAIKQSKQLIPMTPSLPKTLASNLSDKSKLKGSRTADISGMPKGVAQSSSLSHPVRSSRSDVSKNPQVGNFQVLNREKSCLSPTAKEVQNLTNGTRVVSVHGIIPCVNALPKKSSNFSRKSDPKNSEFSLTHCSNLDKRPSPQAQDRNDFFNSLRKKAPLNHATPWQQNHCSTSSSAAERSSDQNMSAIASDCQAIDSSASDTFVDYSESGNDSLNGNCKSFLKEPERFDHDDNMGENSFRGSVVPEEKEFEFLRSLGWVEDDGEEAITPEEIASFYSKLRKHVTSPELTIPESVNEAAAAAAADKEKPSSCYSGEP